MKDKHIYLLVILAWSSFIGFLSCMEDKDLTELKPQSTKQTELDTVTIYELPVYKYPSGATGSLRFDWMTGEKGKLIE